LLRQSLEVSLWLADERGFVNNEQTVSMAFISGAAPMNYQAFSNDSITTMYEVVRGPLDADDTLKARGEEIRFRVRETPDWKKHAADLEMEMIRRGMTFKLIDWSEDQAELPL
jgi:hypothetical protein